MPTKSGQAEAFALVPHDQFRQMTQFQNRLGGAGFSPDPVQTPVKDQAVSSPLPPPPSPPPVTPPPPGQPVQDVDNADQDQRWIDVWQGL